jgi:RNA polymerase sigma factor (sigma-70 family)
MATNARQGPEPALVRAARDGDPNALVALAADSMPLVYNLAGRALRWHADVDDVVQETMLRVMDGIGGLEDPEAYRSWLLGIAMDQVRDHARRRGEAGGRVSMYAQGPEYADLGSDFAGITVLRLGLIEQRRDLAEATRWLDPEDRELLSLWWLEETGYLERRELADALGLPVRHAAVRVHRMKRQLDTARGIVQALRDAGRCVALRSMARGWDGAPSPVWRKRFDRHVRNCTVCAPQGRALIPVSRLLRGLALVPVPEAWRGAAIDPGFDASYLDPEATTMLPRIHAAPREASSHRAGDRPTKRRRQPLVLIGATIAAVAVAAYVVAPGRGLPTVPFAESTEPVPVAALPSGAPSQVSLSPTATKSHSPSASAKPTSTPSHHTSTAAAPPPTTQTSSTSPDNAANDAGASGSTAQTSSRKGVGAWTFSGDDQALADSGASWFYTWSSTDDGLSAPSAGFVPMIWGSGSVTSTALAQAKQDTSCGCVLGFNEPDNSGQSNMTPSQALALWPQLESTGLQLGSPAVASGGATPGGWLDQFMSGADSAGYRVNFITLHWYGSDFNTSDAVSQLQSYIEAVYDRYHLPIWLTEFALISFANGGQTFPTETQQAAFLTSATAMLDSLPYVQRYAWFGLGATTLPSSGLYQSGPVATPVGTAFQAAQ